MLNILQCPQTCIPPTPVTENYLAQNVSVYDNETLQLKKSCWQLLSIVLLWRIPLPPSLSRSVYVLFLCTSTVYLRFDRWWSASEKHPKQVRLTGIILRSSLQQSIWAAKCKGHSFHSLQFSSVAQSCPTLWDPINCSTPGLPVHHQLPESTQTHVHCVSNAIQPSYPLSSPSPVALNLSEHQSLFKWVSSLHQVAKILEFQLQHQFFTFSQTHWPVTWTWNVSSNPDFLPSWSKQHGCLSLPGLIFPNFTLCFNVLICISNACFVYLPVSSGPCQVS